MTSQAQTYAFKNRPRAYPDSPQAPWNSKQIATSSPSNIVSRRYSTGIANSINLPRPTFVDDLRNPGNNHATVTGLKLIGTDSGLHLRAILEPETNALPHAHQPQWPLPARLAGNDK